MNQESQMTCIEDEGARAWQRGYAFWQVPDYRTKRHHDAWKRGYDRAEAEFGNIHGGQPGRWEWRPHHGYVGDR